MNTERVKLKEKEVVLLGTAHVSQQSVEDVRALVESEKPDRVCVEIDPTRYRSLVNRSSFSELDIVKVFREKKGFLLLANLVLSAFQRRLGLDLGVKPGDEMLEAINIAKNLGVPFSLCDRDIQVTLRRAWSKSSFWSKNKMLAAMLSSMFVSEKIDELEIEKLKQKNVLQGMLEELSEYLPSVKEVLIDERDRYLAAQIHTAPGKRIVGVVGAGHVDGVIRSLQEFDRADIPPDISVLEKIPPRGIISKMIPWLVPVIVVGLIAVGFFRAGWELSLNMIWKWILVNGTLSAVGAIIALAHPVTIIVSFLGAPLTSVNPAIGIGILAGIVETTIKRPRVRDFESLHSDILSLRGFYRNRFIHIFVVFFLASLGSAIGTFVGIPFLTSLLR